MVDRELVTKFLSDKQIDMIVSSPYKRAIDNLNEAVVPLELGNRIAGINEDMAKIESNFL